jgi:GntR family transcriptional regulator, transcriptional repressor for pyruvate dehydrogenase complex
LFIVEDQWFDHFSKSCTVLSYDMQFHRAVALASGNPIVATLMDMVTVALYEMKVQTIEHATHLEESAAMHRKIYQAIRAGKADAAREAMTKHLELAQRDFAAEKDGSHADKNGGSRPRVNGRRGKRSSKGNS